MSVSKEAVTVQVAKRTSNEFNISSAIYSGLKKVSMKARK